MEGQAERGAAQLHARSPTARRAELVDDRVLDDLRRVERMIEKGVVDRRIDPQRVGDLQLLAPVDLFHRGVERLGALHPEAAEWLEDADRRPALENGPIERLLLLPRLRRKLDRPPADPQVGGADRFELPGEDPFEPLERPRRHPRRLVGDRRRERAGNGMNGRERRRHGGHEQRGVEGRKQTILPSGRHKNGSGCHAVEPAWPVSRALERAAHEGSALTSPIRLPAGPSSAHHVGHETSPFIRRGPRAPPYLRRRRDAGRAPALSIGPRR